MCFYSAFSPPPSLPWLQPGEAEDGQTLSREAAESLLDTLEVEVEVGVEEIRAVVGGGRGRRRAGTVSTSVGALRSPRLACVVSRRRSV